MSNENIFRNISTEFSGLPGYHNHQSYVNQGGDKGMAQLGGIFRDIVDNLYVVDWAARTVIISMLLDVKCITDDNEKVEWFLDIKNSIDKLDPDAYLSSREPLQEKERSRLENLAKDLDLNVNTRIYEMVR